MLKCIKRMKGPQLYRACLLKTLLRLEWVAGLYKLEVRGFCAKHR